MLKKIVILCILISNLCIWTQETEKTERIIYVPYQQLEQLFQNKKDKGIYLQYEEYQKLLDLAEKGKETDRELPAKTLISKAVYSCEVIEQFLHVEVKYTLDVLASGWHTFPLGFENIAIKKAMLDNKPAFLSLKGSTYELIFHGKETGKQQLDISFVVPIHFQKTISANVNFSVPRSPIAELSLAIPHKAESPRVKVDITPSLTKKVVETDTATKITALLGNNNKIGIKWETEVERKVEIKQVVHAENTTTLKVGENFLQLHSALKYDIIQGKVNYIDIKIPEGFTVYSVKSKAGQGINDWDVNKEKSVLHINLLENAIDLGEGKTDLLIEITLEKIIKNVKGQFAVPKLETVGTEREKGHYYISIDDLHTLKVISRKDVSQLDVHDLNNSDKDVKFAFKYLKKPYELTAELTKIDPEYEVVTNISGYLDETLYTLYAHFQFEIKKSRIFQTQIEIPTGFMLVDVLCYDNNDPNNQVKEYFVKDNLLSITFKKAMKSKKLKIRVHFQQKLDEKDVREIDLPVFKVVGAKREKGNIGLGVKSSFSITTIANTSQKVSSLDINKLFQTGDRPPYQKVDIGLRYHGHPIAAKFKIEKREPYITAEVYDYISVNEGVLKHDFEIYYLVEHTGVKEFSFSLPSEIAVKVPKSRITDTQKRIKEIDIVPNKEKNIHVYKVSTQSDILGTYKINVSYEEKLKQIDEDKTLKLDIFELITINTKRENGFIIIKKNNNLSLDFTDATLLETSDINDPTFAARGNKTDVLAIFKYFTHGYKLSILLQKLQFEPVLNTVINRFHISSTVNKDFLTQNEAVVSIINNRKQFLDFTVPPGSKVTSVARLTKRISYRMNARQLEEGNYFESITPSKNKDGYRVNINSNVKKGASFVLVIKYNYPIQGGEMKKYGNFQINPIQFGDIPVSYFTWDLGLPREFSYMRFDSNLVRKNIYQYRRANLFNVFTLQYLNDIDSNKIGIWHALFDIGNVNRAVIKQDAETGVIPKYDIEGKLFSFSRLSGDGYIKVEYMHSNWVYALYLIAFLIVWFIVATVPKLKIISRLHLSLFLFAAALILSTLDLQGYGHMHISIIYGILFGVAGIFFGGLVRLTFSSEKKEEQKKKDVFHRNNKQEQNQDKTSGGKNDE